MLNTKDLQTHWPNNILDKNKTGKEIENKQKEVSKDLLVLQENPQETITKLTNILLKDKDGNINPTQYIATTNEEIHYWNLYTISKINNKNKLIKITTWEFNTEVFNQNKKNKSTETQNNYKQIRWFSRLNIPVFLLDNTHIENETSNQDSIKYIKEHSIIVMPKKKQAYLVDWKWVNINNINILPAEDSILKIKNSILKTKFNDSELKFIKIFIENRQKKDLNNFKHTIKHNWNSFRSDEIWLTPEEIKKRKTYEKFIKVLIKIVSDENEDSIKKKIEDEERRKTIEQHIEELHNLIKSYNLKTEEFE